MKILMILAVSFGVSVQAVQIKPTTPVEGPDLVSGKTAQVTTDGKKGMVVVFLSAKCPCSDSHVGELIKLSKEHAEFNFVAVHTNANESVELSKSYFAAKKLPFPVIQDGDAKIADRFKAFKTPHAFIIRPDGKFAYQGGVSNSADCTKSDRNFVREALEDLKADREVRTANGRTLGCVITRS